MCKSVGDCDCCSRFQSIGNFYMPIFAWKKSVTGKSVMNETQWLDACENLSSIYTNRVGVCDAAQKVITSIHSCIHVHINIYIQHVQRCTHICIHTHTYIHTHIHTHTYIHTSRTHTRTSHPSILMYFHTCVHTYRHNMHAL